jgi:hypothetical protein
VKTTKLNSFNTCKKGIKQIRNKTIEIKTVVESADIIENANMEKKRAINSMNSIKIK